MKNQIVDELTKADESKLINCSISLDFTKTFKTVNHNILFSKLKWYKIKDEISNINEGIPKSCRLGPFIFLKYINEIFSATNFEIVLFKTDDDCLNFQHSDPVYVNNLINGVKAIGRGPSSS